MNLAAQVASKDGKFAINSPDPDSARIDTARLRKAP
jgi:hypothetical protein